MFAVQEIQILVDSFHYWDARVTQLNCSYFADEIELIYNDGDLDIVYRFLECYKAIFDHVKDYDKLRHVKNMSIAQMPYFLQNIEIGEITERGINFYTCKINMFPLDLEIWCKDIKITPEKVR
jgi:hypothetical protein